VSVCGLVSSFLPLLAGLTVVVAYLSFAALVFLRSIRLVPPFFSQLIAFRYLVDKCQNALRAVLAVTDSFNQKYYDASGAVEINA
jgi:hypothetical protein